MYNETYRKGMNTQYTFENVCIVPGGRAGLSRVAAVVGDVYVKHARDDLDLSTHSHPATWASKFLTTQPMLNHWKCSAAWFQSLLREFPRRLRVILTQSISLEAEHGYKLDLKQVKRDISNQGLSVLLASNPRNPTGQLIQYEYRSVKTHLAYTTITEGRS
jgi:hypothetical protein